MNEISDMLRNSATGPGGVFSNVQNSVLRQAADRIEELELALRRVAKRISEPLPNDELSNVESDMRHARSICANVLSKANTETTK